MGPEKACCAAAALVKRIVFRFKVDKIMSEGKEKGRVPKKLSINRSARGGWRG